MEYSKPFVLEPTKLERLLDVIHELLAAQPNITTHDRFDVFMTGNRGEQLKSLEEVLALENSKKYRIERLLIICSASTGDDLHPGEYEIRVDFGVVKQPKGAQATASAVKLVTVHVRSDVLSWNRQVLSCLPATQPNLFLWGDEVARYNAILQRRRFLWTVVVGILVVSIAGRLLAEGVFTSIPK